MIPNLLRPLARISLVALSLYSSLASAQTPVSAPPGGKFWVYLGTYTNKTSKGIYRSELELKTGKLSAPELAGEAASPSFLAIHPNGKWLYAINEVSSFDGKKTGGVTGFAIEPDGKLTKLNQESSGGTGPAHLAIDPTGKWLLVANYGGGSSALLPIGADGKLSAPTSIVVHTQKPAEEGAKPQASHAHWAGFSPDGKYGFICDAGLDKLHQFKIDTTKGELVPNEPPFLAIGPGKGTGPRHLAYSVDKQHAYLVNETNMTISTLKFDADKGTFSMVGTISTLPAGVENNKFSTAEVFAHPAGKFVYSSNRSWDSIVTYAIDSKTAELNQTHQFREGVKVPRNFNIDPTGQYLLIANQDGGSVLSCRIDATTGELKATGESLELDKPVCVLFLAPPK